MVGVPRRERKVYVIGSYIMVFSTLLLSALLPCFNVACAGVANGRGWVSWAEAVASAQCDWVGTRGCEHCSYGQ